MINTVSIMELTASWILNKYNFATLRSRIGNNIVCKLAYEDKVFDIPDNKFHSSIISTKFDITSFLLQFDSDSNSRQMFKDSKEFYGFVDRYSGKRITVLIDVDLFKNEKLYANTIYITGISTP